MADGHDHGSMTFPKPPDVPDYVPVEAVYNANGINPKGANPPPAYAYELTDPNPIADNAGWLIMGDYNGTGFKSQAQGAVEAKFRTHINAFHVLRDDPVRNYGRPGTSHWHTFLGNAHINAWSTYNSVRNHPQSVAAGGPINGTGYWQPSVLVPINGKIYAKLPDFAVVYYNAAFGKELVHLPRGLRYVMGWQMDDHHMADYATETNAQGAGNYAQDFFDGWAGWKAEVNGQEILTDAGGLYSRSLRLSDGSDPWGGRATAGRLCAVLIAPKWWDGTNLWSPGGYKHFRQDVRHIATGNIGGPAGWYETPQLELFTWFTHGGFADYGTWELSSDHMLDATGHAPMLPCSTMHADWLGGWSAPHFTMWQRKGNGVDGFEAHDMGDSILCDKRKMITSQPAPDGSRMKQIDLDQRLATIPANMILLPSTGSGQGPFSVGGRGV